MFDRKTRVLIVDDMLAMRTVLDKILRELGLEDITEAVDGKDAWEKVVGAGAHPFSLIISDWNMPNMNGLELLKHIRADRKFSQTPFVLVTAEAGQFQVTEAVRCGVDQYVVKPFTIEALKEKLEMAFRKRVVGKAVCLEN